MGEQISVALVRLLRIAHAGILAHCPEPSAVHSRLHAARERRLAGITNLRFGIMLPPLKIGRSVDRLHFNAGGGVFRNSWSWCSVGGFRLPSHGLFSAPDLLAWSGGFSSPS